MSDVFERAEQDNPAAAGSNGFLDTLFRTRPRLVPMAMLSVSLIALIILGAMTSFMAESRVSEPSGPSDGIWTAYMVLVACAPWVALGMLPVIQRRHLYQPQPFYRYCNVTWITIVTAFPVLWISGWIVGGDGLMSRSGTAWLILAAYTLATALFPVAARLNHAAWLRLESEPSSH